MKNIECIVYLTTKKGKRQVYRRDSKGWTQKSSKGIVRRMTSEQFLSHLLPPLAKGNKSPLTVRVEKIKKSRKN